MNDNYIHWKRDVLENIVTTCDGIDILDRNSMEFQFAKQNLQKLIDRLDSWNGIKSLIKGLSKQFDLMDHYQCRNLAQRLLRDIKGI